MVDAELAMEVLRQHQLYSSEAMADFDTELIEADPPLHTSNRSLFQPFFSPRELADLSDYTAAIVKELAVGLGNRSSFDFVTEFAIPLTQAVGGQLLGLTRAEREALQAMPTTCRTCPNSRSFLKTIFRIGPRPPTRQ